MSTVDPEPLTLEQRHQELLRTPADQAPTVVLDFETTGLSAAMGDRVCEVAVVRAIPADGGRAKRYTTRVNPGMPMPAEAQAVHGLSDADLAGAPPFEQVLPVLAPWLEGAVLVAHNAAFDLAFLRAECHRLGLPVPNLGPVICTLELARHVYGFSRCSLEALARRAGVHQGQAHRAVEDAATTLRLYKALLEGLSLDGCPTVGALQEATVELAKEGAGRRRIAEALQDAARTRRPIVIDYTRRNGEGALTVRRTITVKAAPLPEVEAWCHLKGEDRVFHLRRVQRVIPNPAG